jgi:hypothetical protein
LAHVGKTSRANLDGRVGDLVNERAECFEPASVDDFKASPYKLDVLL